MENNRNPNRPHQKLELSPEHLEALRTYLLEHYHMLANQLRASSEARQLGADVVTDALHHVLYDELERVLLDYDGRRDLVAYVLGVVRKDWAVGVRAQCKARFREVKKEVTYPLGEDGEELSVREEDEWGGDPAEVFERKHSADRWSGFSDADFLRKLHEELSAFAEAWAREDASTPDEQRAREVVYEEALWGVLETMRAGKPPRTPTGKLRLDSKRRRRFAALAGRSPRTVQDYLRDLEPRVRGLERG